MESFKVILEKDLNEFTNAKKEFVKGLEEYKQSLIQIPKLVEQTDIIKNDLKKINCTSIQKQYREEDFANRKK